MPLEACIGHQHSGCPGFDRRTISARRPVVRPVERPWSRRTFTHSEAGSTRRSTACLATTVEPASASRLMTTPSLGASRRTLSRCWRSPAFSAARRCRSWRAPARLALAPPTAASAEICSCNLASTAPALMTLCAPRSTYRRAVMAARSLRATASFSCACTATSALPARAIDASNAAKRSSRSTGSISASNWPAWTASPTSTAARRTRRAAVGPIK